MKTCNFLFIGKTGSGKTTLFRALKDYLAGTGFSDRTLVKAREDRKPGESDTRTFTKEYVIGKRDAGVTIQFLDTPGLGDSSGILQDQKNLKEIVGAMKNVRDISAICFVFTNSTNRAEPNILYIMNELKQLLSKAAAKVLVPIVTSVEEGVLSQDVSEALGVLGFDPLMAIKVNNKAYCSAARAQINKLC